MNEMPWFYSYEYYYEWLLNSIALAKLIQHGKKPKPNKAPIKFHESHRRVMRSVNRNR